MPAGIRAPTRLEALPMTDRREGIGRHAPVDAPTGQGGPVTGVPFADRHIGPSAAERAAMAEAAGYDGVGALVDAAVPARIRTDRPLALPPAHSEVDVLACLWVLVVCFLVFFF